MNEFAWRFVRAMIGITFIVILKDLGIIGWLANFMAKLTGFGGS